MNLHQCHRICDIKINTGCDSNLKLLLLLLLNRFSHVQLCDPIDCAAHQAPLSLGFSRQEHWSGLPLPSPSNLKGPHQGIIVCIYFSIHSLLTSESVSHSVMSNCMQPHGL